MNQRTHSCAAAMVLVLLASVLTLYSQTAAQILLIGMFHGDEIDAEHGSTWLSVVPHDSGELRIEKTTIVVETVFDPIVDAEGETTGRQVSVPSGRERPIFLVRGVDSILPGPFETASANPVALKTNISLPITLAVRQRYELEIRCGADAPTTPDGFLECPLVLSSGRDTQVLSKITVYQSPEREFSIASEAVPQHLWSGDIDHDGKLDLLLDLTNHYNLSRPTLFLSSEADEESLVAEVASLDLTGC